jgi:peptide/nickel transport system ATP-binding protein
MSSVLQVTNLHQTFGHGDIFRDVTFSVNRGETLGYRTVVVGNQLLEDVFWVLEKLTSGTIFFQGAIFQPYVEKNAPIYR